MGFNIPYTIRMSPDSAIKLKIFSSQLRISLKISLAVLGSIIWAFVLVPDSRNAAIKAIIPIILNALISIAFSEINKKNLVPYYDPLKSPFGKHDQRASPYDIDPFFC